MMANNKAVYWTCTKISPLNLYMSTIEI
jgi:hypothetical protein